MTDDIDMTAPVTRGELQEELARLTINSQSEKLAIKAELDLLATKMELKVFDPELLALSEQPPNERIPRMKPPQGQMLLREQRLKDSMYAAVERVRNEFDGRTKFRDDVVHTRLTTIRTQYDHLSARIERLEDSVFATSRR
jgi:hypothetical protein